MIKLLQQESQCYFHNRTNLVHSYQELAQPQQRVHFFLMLLYSQSTTEQIVNFVAEALNNTQAPHFSALLTAMWAYSLHTQPSSQAGKRLCSVVSLIQGRNLIDKSQLMSELPQWVIQGAGIAQLQAFQKRFARVYTKINYEQNKHSLLRENNEGFAKLTLLLAGLKNTDDSNAVWKKIVSLIGNFDLDPDRVLDLIVESKLQNSESQQFLQLLKHFRKESVVMTLGHMIQSQKTKSTQTSQAQKTFYCGPPQAFDKVNLQTLFNQLPFMPNPRLFQLIGRSIKAGLFTYNQLQTYLQPTDIQIRTLCGNRAELVLSKINKSFTLSMVEIEQSQMIRLMNEENLQFEGQLLYSTKLALLTQLVRCNDWADFVAAWAPLKTRFELIIYQPLLHALLDLLQWATAPLYKDISFQRFFNFEKKSETFQFQGNNSKEFKPFEEFNIAQIEKLSELLSYIGKNLAFRPKLYIKLCRILKKYVNAIKQHENDQCLKKIKEIVKLYLVPANGYAQNNAPMSLQLYELLQCFEYQFRYECYIVVYRESMTGCPYTARIFQSVKRRQNIIVNNLSKENKKTFIRKIAKITHNQALPVLYWIARRIVMEDYEAVVPEIVAVLSNATPLTLDMTIFVMLYTLNEHKQAPVNIKTHEFQPWFKNVITFISTFFRKYLQADIQPIFDYILMKTALPFSVLEQLDQLPGALLKLLHEILNKMYGSVMIQQVNKTKLDAIAAGPKLQAEILQLSSEVKAVKKSKVMLEKFFWQQNKDHHCGRSLAFNLLVLLCQKRGEVFTKAFIDDLRIMADIYDEYTLLIVQLTRVLFYQAQDYSHYAELLPSNPLTLLLQQYKLPLQYACEIVRPGVKHIATMNQSEWSNLVAQFRQAYEYSLRDPKYLLKGYRTIQKVESYVNLYKQKIFEILSPEFLTAFWFLTIDSVYFPAKSYAQKIQDIKKKLQQKRNQKETEKLKSLLEKLTKEEEQQRRKYTQTFGEANLYKLELEVLKSGEKEKEKKENYLLQFAEAFAQTCLLPRMMLDRAEALYCVKFTIEMIKANKMPGTKMIRLLTFLMEYIMNYLPFTTHREASNCLSVFLAEILSIFTNWSDSAKLKQDMKRVLGVEDNPGKDNYPKLRDYLVKLFERVGNIVKSIKQQPYVIKNCLYLLEKVESIPGYKQQADELMQHMNQLKELYTAVDMRTILDRQIAMLGVKKNDLPERPQEKKSEDKKGVSKPAEQNPKETSVKPPIPSKSPLVNTNVQVEQRNLETTKAEQSQPNPKQQISKALQSSQSDRNKQNEPARTDKHDEQKPKSKFESRFSDKPPEKQDKKSDIKQKTQDLKRMKDSKEAASKEDENKNVNVPTVAVVSQNKQVKYFEGKPQSKAADTAAASSVIPPPKRFIDVRKEQELKTQGFSQPLTNVKPLQTTNTQPVQSLTVQSQAGVVQPPVTVPTGAQGVQQVPQNVLSQQRDNSIKTSQEEVKKETIDSNSKNQKPASLAVAPTSNLSQPENHPKTETSRKTQEKRDKSPLNSSKQIKIDRNRENNRQPSKDNRQRDYKERQEKAQDSKWEKKKEGSHSPHSPARGKDSRWKERDQGKKWEYSKQKSGFYTKDKKSQQRQGRESRKQDRKEDRKDDKKDRQREKEKDKERQKRHDKYRSRSRQKYSRR